MLIKLNVTIAVYRERSILRENPLLEVIGFTAITAAISYLVRTIFKYCSDGTLRGFQIVFLRSVVVTHCLPFHLTFFVIGCRAPN